ncbi:PHD finger protein 21A [Agrilus planipennis]|uniref:PHD finger protein 21A n=1 Tax=Agrilus planipennis TaxID=224129 RepID=A0A1W4WSQ8_AGRPL|nr:PHD finger protein 21A [Agrilus planipennis]
MKVWVAIKITTIIHCLIIGIIFSVFLFQVEAVKMIDLPISKELKDEIQVNQNLLKNAIRNHQTLIYKLQEEPENVEIQKRIQCLQQEIVTVGLEQKGIIERIRKELKSYEKNIQENNVTAALEEKRNNLTNALGRARKQTINVRPVSAASFSGSDDSSELPVYRSLSPEVVFNPLKPQDLGQNKFLHYYGLCTHEIYKELVNKRAERKRRSTANPQFLYGGKGWDSSSDFLNVIVLSLSPPNTRQAVKNRNKLERSLSSPGRGDSPPDSPIETSKKLPPSFPSIPNLPSGLTIERVNPNRSSPEEKHCIVCRSSGNLSTCETCTGFFHISCHNRPLVQTPRQCPRCITNKDVRTVGSLNVPSVDEKLQEKEKLYEKNRQLAAELTQLQDRHSQLTISLRDQKNKQDQLMDTHHCTKTKIKTILDFINSVKSRSYANSEAVDKDVSSTTEV